MVRRRLFVSISLSSFALLTHLLSEWTHPLDAYGDTTAANQVSSSGSSTDSSTAVSANPPTQTSVGTSTGSGTSSTASGFDLSNSLSVLQIVSEGLAMGLAGHQSITILASAAAGAKPIPASADGGGQSSSDGGSQSSGAGGTSSVPTGSGSQPSGPSAPATLSTTTYYLIKNSLLYKHDSSGFTYVVGPPAAFMKPGVTYYSSGTNFYVKQGTSFVYVGQFENPYRQLDLRTPSTITAQQITGYISANDSLSPLIGLAPVYIQAQQQYGVNAQYLVAHSIIESTWGSSQIAHDKNNLFGYSAYDSSPYASATTFPSKAYAILFEAWFVRKYYLDATGSFFHGPNLDGMNVDYATDPNWAESIAAVMWNMAPYQASDYTGVATLPESSQEPVFSYPSGMSGQVTTANLNVRAGPGLTYSILSQLSKGSKVTLTGWAPGWYRTTLASGVSGYISSQYVQPTNLGTITGDNVNLRAGPSSDQMVIGQLQFGNQIELLGQSADKQWQQVTTMDNVTGYVYSSYVGQMH